MVVAIVFYVFSDPNPMPQSLHISKYRPCDNCSNCCQSFAWQMFAICTEKLPIVSPESTLTLHSVLAVATVRIAYEYRLWISNMYWCTAVQILVNIPVTFFYEIVNLSLLKYSEWKLFSLICDMYSVYIYKCPEGCIF